MAVISQDIEKGPSRSSPLHSPSKKKTGVEAKDYYKILMKKYEEEGNSRLFKVVREFEYILRDDREREKDW